MATKKTTKKTTKKKQTNNTSMFEAFILKGTDVKGKPVSVTFSQVCATADAYGTGKATREATVDALKGTDLQSEWLVLACNKFKAANDIAADVKNPHAFFVAMDPTIPDRSDAKKKLLNAHGRYNGFRYMLRRPALREAKVEASIQELKAIKAGGIKLPSDASPSDRLTARIAIKRFETGMTSKAFADAAWCRNVARDRSMHEYAASDKLYASLVIADAQKPKSKQKGFHAAA